MKLNILIVSIYLLLLLSVSSVFSQPHRMGNLLALQFAPAPDASITLIPTTSPSEIPSNSNSPSQSPFSSSPLSSPFPSPVSSPVWCVAKPNAEADKVQEAMDYACATGEVICEEILPGGPCFYPDNVIAHASFAFNGYWQFAKSDGGNCDFDGAAMLVTSDPSFEGCHFVLI